MTISVNRLSCNPCRPLDLYGEGEAPHKVVGGQVFMAGHGDKKALAAGEVLCLYAHHSSFPVDGNLCQRSVELEGHGLDEPRLAATRGSL